MNFLNIDNKEFNLTKFKDKNILICNTASKCGFANQLNLLQELKKRYPNLVIICIPSSSFLNQEHSAKKLCSIVNKANYDFIFTQKYQVIGKNRHPFFKKVQSDLGFLATPKWNYYKYIINKNGDLVKYFTSFTKPNSKKVTKYLDSLI